MAEGRFLEDCEICRLLQSDDGSIVILAMPWWRVVLNPNQDYLGRVWVTLLDHRSSLGGLATDQWLELKRVTELLERATRSAFGAELLNWSWLMNNAYLEPAPTPHVHAHVRPRYAVTPTVSGVSFPDDEFGRHYVRIGANNVSVDLLRQIGQELTAAVPAA